MSDSPASQEKDARRTEPGTTRGGFFGATMKVISDPCDICEGPCRYGNCLTCGGHSEHNVGCSEIH